MKNLLNETFGKWTVIAPAIRADRTGKRMWLCRCECGTQATVQQGNLTSGLSKQCLECSGKRLPESTTKHGQARAGKETPEYRAWKGMMERCRNPRNQAWKNYGGRGITVCARWHDFAAFLADMGPKPTPTHTLERRDNNVGYSPENCSWATRLEQNNNSRNCRYITLDGRAQSVAAWARERGISLNTVRWRLAHGRTPEETFR